MILIATLLLAGCNTPGPVFRGVTPVRISIGQSVFDVRVDGTIAQAIRLNPEYAPRFAMVAPRGVLAIEKVSGCRVRRLEGDQAVMIAQLDCGDGPLSPLPVHREFDCEIHIVNEDFTEVFCESYPE